MGTAGPDWAVLAGAGVAVLLTLLVAAIILLPIFVGGRWLIRRLWAFLAGEAADLVRLIGAVVAGLVFGAAAMINAALMRKPSVEHYLRGLHAEGEVLLGCLYRVLIGHPAKLLSLTPLTEILEDRVPRVMATAPSTSGARAGKFDGYAIVGTLPTGGSGARLYIAEPSPRKLAELNVAGRQPVGRVVIKSFVLGDGSSLPQIVSESRVLTAASQLGLVLDHRLGEGEFHYVTRYEPGEPLTRVIRSLHDEAGSAGLRGEPLGRGLGLVADLLRTLREYHAAALWHKDVKPDNVIVTEAGAKLVDFGLVTPMRSGLTLTTHGTEYFRDPEMVRLALRGTKVQDVDGAKFDVYGAGAVLYALIENTFPAHGGLSRISKPCPDAVRWIVNRAMAEYDKRYSSAAAMLADVEHVLSAPDAFGVRIGELPSVAGATAEPIVEPEPLPDTWPVDSGEPSSLSEVPDAGPPAQAAARAKSEPQPDDGPADSGDVPASGPATPRLRVRNWWTGRYDIDGR